MPKRKITRSSPEKSSSPIKPKTKAAKNNKASPRSKDPFIVLDTTSDVEMETSVVTPRIKQRTSLPDCSFNKTFWQDKRTICATANARTREYDSDGNLREDPIPGPSRLMKEDTTETAKVN